MLELIFADTPAAALAPDDSVGAVAGAQAAGAAIASAAVAGAVAGPAPAGAAPAGAAPAGAAPAGAAPAASPPAASPALVIIGRKARLLSPEVASHLPAEVAPIFRAMVDSLSPRDVGDSTATWLPGPPPRRLVVIAVSEASSRHNSPGRPDALTHLLSRHTPREGATLLVCLDHADHAFAAGCAVGRLFPDYTRKTRSRTAQKARRLTVCLLPPAPAASAGGAPTAAAGDAAAAAGAPTTAAQSTAAAASAPAAAIDLPRIRHAVAGIRLAARLIDTSPAELSTDALIAEAAGVAEQVGAEILVIRGDALRDEGLMGLHSVGRAATHPAALVQLSHGPEAGPTTVWVGKGIVFDTGGLAIKAKSDMPGMKADMGGAAAVLGAFAAAVRTGHPGRLVALLCLAENSIGPESTRPDDIVTLYSGRTVEVNNPDAEGRLVLSDGVAWAVQKLKPAVIIDLATLTGAQRAATGKRHAALVTNDEAWEQRAVRAGRVCGDLLHPLPYCPEFFRREFNSEVADMKNSVKDRNNAQSACAAQFIAEHLGNYGGPWVHIDLAGPAVLEERGTGFGVALLLELLGPA